MVDGGNPELPKQTELVPAGDDTKQQLSTVQLVPMPGAANSDVGDRDPNSKFSLGPDNPKLLTRQELHQRYPELEQMMKEAAGMGGSGVETPIQLNGMQDAFPSSVYKFDAFKQMIAKYGADRVTEMFDTLKQISPAGLSSYREELRFSNVNPASWPKTNERLYNMAALCEPGTLEAVKDLVGKMRSEGFTKALDLRETNPAMVTLLSNDANERAAFIEFENYPTMAPGFFLKDNPQIDLAHTPPSQVLAQFKLSEEASKQ